jgi:hypothetical protein
MNHSHPISAHAYVVKLGPLTEGEAGRLQGRIEHVLSGRRHDFASAQALIEILLQEEREVARESPPSAQADPLR